MKQFVKDLPKEGEYLQSIPVPWFTELQFLGLSEAKFKDGIFEMKMEEMISSMESFQTCNNQLSRKQKQLILETYCRSMMENLRSWDLK